MKEELLALLANDEDFCRKLATALGRELAVCMQRSPAWYDALEITVSLGDTEAVDTLGGVLNS